MESSTNEFSCGGKCRICPYPGANCKTITLKPKIPERDEPVHAVWMSQELQDEFLRKMHVK